MQVLENIIAENKEKAADELCEAKAALEQAQEQAKVSLDHQVEQLAVRATKGEDRQVGLEQKQVELISNIYLVKPTFLLQMNTDGKHVK